MTDTLQPLPAWMTYSASVVTLPDGEVQTSYTILQLPLTYYGPSIPLGTDWVYGGLTSPASEPTPSTTSSFTTTSPPATPTPTSTAIPSSSTAIPSSSSSIATPTSIGQSMSTSSQSSSIASSPSATITSMSTMTTSSSSGSPATSSAVPMTSGHNSGLSHNSIVAIICGSIAGALILLVLMLLCCILIRRQRTRGRQYMVSSPPMSFLRAIPTSLSSLGSSYVFLGQDRTNSRAQRDSRQPGVGSPRHSGEEEDAFLVPRRGALAAGDDKSGSSAHSRGSVWAVGPDGTHVRIWSSRGTEEVDLQTDMDTTVVGDNSHPHAYFATADHLAAPGAAAAFVSAGQGLPEKQVYEKAAAPSSSDLHEEFGGLQLLNVPHQSMASRRPLSVDSGVSLDPHSPAQFMFAHRVQVADPRIPSASSPPEERRALIGESSPIGHANSQGSWNPLSNLSRLSGWGFLRTEAQSSRPASPGSWLSRTPKSKRSQASVRNPSSLGHHTEEDDDSRVGLLASGSTSPPLVHPRFQQLNTMAEDRPNSSVSGRSGGSSAYLTAQESPIVSSMGSRNASIPSVPSNAMGLAQLPIRAPPTAHTPPVTTTRYAYYPVPSDQPPAYATTDPATSGGAMDILDLPVPMPVPTFTSSTSRRPPAIQLPPGLFGSGLPAPRVWTDLAGSSSGGTPLSPIASVSVSNESDDMTVPDLLDAAPPRAAEVWRSLADARDRGTRVSTAQPTLVHPGLADRRQSYNVSVHAGSNATGSASSRSAATQLSPLSDMFLTSPMAAAQAPVRNPSPPLSAVGHAGGFNQPALRTTQPLVIRRSGSDLSGPAVSYHSAGSSSLGSSAEGPSHAGQEGAASLTAFGPPQPGMFMSRNPYAPLTQTAPHSTIRLVGTTPPNGTKQDGSRS